MSDRAKRRTYERQCVVCGKTFQATRHDASLCSSTCRSRQARTARAGDHKRFAVETAVQGLIDQTADLGDPADLGALKRLRRLIDEAIQAAERVETV